jgi:hypothetical protein
VDARSTCTQEDRRRLRLGSTLDVDGRTLPTLRVPIENNLK